MAENKAEEFEVILPKKRIHHPDGFELYLTLIGLMLIMFLVDSFSVYNCVYLLTLTQVSHDIVSLS